MCLFRADQRLNKTGPIQQLPAIHVEPTGNGSKRDPESQLGFTLMTHLHSSTSLKH